MIDKTDDLLKALRSYDFDLCHKILDDYWLDLTRYGEQETNINFDKLVTSSCHSIESFICSSLNNKFSGSEKIELLYLITQCYKTAIRYKDHLIRRQDARKD